jgi:hypothetical protein
MNAGRLTTRCLAVLAVGAAVAACGPTPPQAPLKQAMKLSVATGGISTACGLTYQVTAFPGDHRSDLETLEATASSNAIKLASVYANNAAWIYQGETVGKIVGDAVAMLKACGLRRAAGVLSAAASRRASGTAR